jgi:hypothetical protein
VKHRRHVNGYQLEPNSRSAASASPAWAARGGRAAIESYTELKTVLPFTDEMMYRAASPPATRRSRAACCWARLYVGGQTAQPGAARQIPPVRSSISADDPSPRQR